ncbi:hypothetical protein [Kutzneria buriramensis]|uniref:RING-type E3 ubiquitin transferase n=1 Tax=Kutzneria buriramensis TaxID=1045776 RepID=A0A3E0HZL1_9PSEU|nr:hypothetical protein [Kutzneria buriramensis]REH51903.1 hypothetical protein BCF44_103352 [Kutzneria buriramensis]
MLTIAVLALLLGACLLIAALTSLLLKAGGTGQRRLVARTPVTPLGRLRGGMSRVAAVGATAYGPEGPVTAPVSGEQCVWFRVRLIRSPSRHKDEVGGEDVLLERLARTTPALTDASGTVPIDPRILTEPPNLDDPVVTEQTMRLLSRDSAAEWASLIPANLIEDKRSHETLQLWETRLPAGKQAYLLARTRRGPILEPGTFTVFTTDDAETVRGRRQERVASATHLVRFLGVSGLVITALSVGALFLLV